MGLKVGLGNNRRYSMKSLPLNLCGRFRRGLTLLEARITLDPAAIARISRWERPQLQPLNITL
jgi:hypothetical protein